MIAPGDCGLIVGTIFVLCAISPVHGQQQISVIHSEEDTPHTVDRLWNSDFSSEHQTSSPQGLSGPLVENGSPAVQRSVDPQGGSPAIWDLKAVSDVITLRCNCSHEQANCAFRNLTIVPHDCDPPSVIYLDLHNNSISELTNQTFISYTSLRYLDLSNNNISALEEEAFLGLGQLKHLNLANNRLVMSDSMFPDDIFLPLTNLQTLRINKNNCDKFSGNVEYPDRALSRLTNLRSLYMDGLKDKAFKFGFQNMIRLENLSLVGYIRGCCHINSLTNMTFMYLSQVRYLNINSCYILGRNIQADTFSSLTHLVSLDITHNEDIDIEHLDNIFYGLKKIPTLKILRMQLIVNRYSLGICLDSYYIRNFPQNLEYFNAQENNLESVDRNVTRLLSPSLKVLDLSGNRFVFGTYLQDLHLMKNLNKLRLNGGGFTYSLPSQYPFKLSKSRADSHRSLYGEDSDDALAQIHGAGVQDHTPFILKLPPKLQHMEMNNAGLTYKLSNLTIDPDNLLQNLSMKGNRFPELIGPFIGFQSLKFLDLSSNYVQHISDQFFLYLTTLEYLNLGSNLLGDFFSNQHNPHVFSSLRNLRILNLSFNDISKLSDDVFVGLDNLHELYLIKNMLIEFKVNISHMKNLTVINLKQNRITQLPEFIQEHINFLLGRHLHVQIDMSLCPISCNCENLNFLSWMIRSKTFSFSKSEWYQCVSADNSYKDILDGYNSTMKTLLRQCSSNTVLFVCVSGATFLVLCVVICLVMYRFRLKIRYLYYAAHVSYWPSSSGSDNMIFQYDAYISYDDKDVRFLVKKLIPDLEKRGLKLLIRHRDFAPACSYASNILQAIQQSRKTVVILTRRHLQKNEWLYFEIQVANTEQIYTGRKVLLFLLMEDLPHSFLEVQLLYHIRNNRYILYPDLFPDGTSVGQLWEELTTYIRDCETRTSLF